MLKEYSILVATKSQDFKEQIESCLNVNVKKYYVDDKESGLELFYNEAPNIVIVEESLLDVAVQIKKSPLRSFVVLISDFKSADVLTQAIDSGIDKYIHKPLECSKFLTVLEQIVSALSLEKEFHKQTKIFKQYQETVDLVNIVSMTDKKGIITYVNENFCNISGYNREELIGQPHNIIRHPDMESKLFEEMWDTIQNEKKLWQGVIKNRKKDGRYYWTDTVIKPILDNEKNVIEYIGIRNDITNEMDMREYFKDQLSYSNKQFKSALNLSKEYKKAINKSSVVTRINPKRKIVYANESFLKIFDYKNIEIKGQSFCSLKYPSVESDATYETLWETVTSGQVWKGVLKKQNKQKETLWMDTTIVPIKDEDKNIVEYMAIQNDVSEIFKLHSEIEKTQREIIYKMGEIGETRSKETGNHVKRVALYSKLLAQLYGLSEYECNILFTASPMHDIGKVGIPDEVLKKPGKLDEEEWKVMQTHSQIGKKILKGSKREVLRAAEIVAYQHHEKYDGSGYPQKLQGEEIHIYGRITALADVFDALGSERYYKPAWEDDKIFALFKEERGKHFDPKLVDLFFEYLDKFLEIRDKYKD